MKTLKTRATWKDATHLQPQRNTKHTNPGLRWAFSPGSGRRPPSLRRRTFQQYALRLVDSRRTFQFYWLREPPGGGSSGLAVTGPLLERPEFLLGVREKRQDGGSGILRLRHREYWVCGGGGGSQQKRHQFPEEGS